MAENNSKNVDVRPKTSRSRSADRKDGYVWSGKKLSWSKKSESCSESEAIGTVENVEIPLRSQERQLSCSSIELDLDHSCGHRFLGRSLKQKLQDAVGQCFPIKNCSGRHSPGLPSCFSHTNGQPCVITANSASCTGGHITGSMMNLVTNNSIEDSDMDSEDEIITLCTSSRKRNKPRWEMEEEILQLEAPPKFHTQIDYVHCLVPDLLQISNNPCYWGVMDKYAAEALSRVSLGPDIHQKSPPLCRA